MGWLSGYSKRKPITLTGGASGAQTDFQLKLAAAYAAAMQSDFDDLRFTQADGTTLIDAWLESKVDDTSAVVWAEFPTTPANTVEQTYYMYYGNVGAASAWDIGNTFIHGDDFEDGTMNAWGGATSSYGAIGGAAYEGSYGCDRTLADGSWQYITAPTDLQNGIWEMWVKQTNTASYPHFEVRKLGASNYISFQIQANTNQIIIKDVGGTGNHTAALTHSTGVWYFLRGRLSGTSARLEVYNTSMALQQSLDATVTDRTDAHGFSCYRDCQFDTYRVRKYAANPPTYAFGSEECEPCILRNPSMGGGMV